MCSQYLAILLHNHPDGAEMLSTGWGQPSQMIMSLSGVCRKKIKGRTGLPCGRAVSGSPPAAGRAQECQSWYRVRWAPTERGSGAHGAGSLRIPGAPWLGASPRAPPPRASSTLTVQVFVYRAMHFSVSFLYSSFFSQWLKSEYNQRFTMGRAPHHAFF